MIGISAPNVQRNSPFFTMVNCSYQMTISQNKSTKTRFDDITMLIVMKHTHRIENLGGKSTRPIAKLPVYRGILTLLDGLLGSIWGNSFSKSTKKGVSSVWNQNNNLAKQKLQSLQVIVVYRWHEKCSRAQMIQCVLVGYAGYSVRSRLNYWLAIRARLGTTECSIAKSHGFAPYVPSIYRNDAGHKWQIL